ncbi:unnamed protein product [Arabidopsis halleri]
MSNITKLTQNNYITWRLQIRSLLEAHELHVFIGEDDLTPPPTITIDNNANQTNPKFTAWIRQDKLLFSAILGSLSLPVQALVARATTTRGMWETLHRTYGNASRGHIKIIKDQIKASTKGSKSIIEYMRGILEKSDQLALLGAPLPHEDLLEHITDGLGDNYRAVIEMVNGRDTPISIEKLHEKLINRENKLRAATTTDVSLPVTANVTQFPQQSSSNSQRGGNSSYCGGNNSSRGGYRPSKPYLGKCQICGVQGHGAKRCPQYQQFAAPTSPYSSQFQP